MDVRRDGDSRSVVKKINYSHDAMIDMIIAEPGISQGQLAAHFGYSQVWVSRVFNSDNFRERLEARKEEVIDPVLKMTLEERLKGLVSQSMDVLAEKMAAAPNVNTAVRVLEIGVRALGYGAKDRGNVTQNNYIVQVPPTSPNAAGWVEQYRPSSQRLAAGDVVLENENGMQKEG